ncbi:SDR family oxidoreductase [Kocuria palustris]|uniref:SDR family oxidoreductase n=1 Tax=Kocuria palustris TaxID=71999 RepID=UPI002043F3EA|nr:SDR family oxidoreductase [Kocuria palustris]MCM3332831.1 SDR family oxidoreductase [Kocuria palustris]
MSATTPDGSRAARPHGGTHPTSSLDPAAGPQPSSWPFPELVGVLPRCCHGAHPPVGSQPPPDPGRYNLSSVAAKTGSPGEYVWYAAAETGVNALTVGLAVEAASHGIQVNAVSPGTTATTIHARAGRPDRATEVGARSPMGDPLNQRRSLLLSSGSSAPRPVTSTVRSSTSPEERDEPRISP